VKESDIIAKTDKAFGGPVSFTRLSVDLAGLGVGEGNVLLVHSSLPDIPASFGRFCLKVVYG